MRTTHTQPRPEQRHSNTPFAGALPSTAARTPSFDSFFLVFPLRCFFGILSLLLRLLPAPAAELARQTLCTHASTALASSPSVSHATRTRRTLRRIRTFQTEKMNGVADIFPPLEMPLDLPLKHIWIYRKSAFWLLCRPAGSRSGSDGLGTDYSTSTSSSLLGVARAWLVQTGRGLLGVLTRHDCVGPRPSGSLAHGGTAAL